MTEELEIKKDILELLKTDNSNLNVVVVPIEQGFYSVSVLAKENSDFKVKDIDIVKRINGIEKIKRIHFNNIVFDKSFEDLSSMIHIISNNDYSYTQEQKSIIKNNNIKIYFNECIFETQEVLLNNIISGSLHFEDCDFGRGVLFNSCILTSLSMESCNIIEAILINDTKLSISPTFHNFINENISITFINVDFQGGIDFILDDKKKIKELKFESIIFKNPVLFFNILEYSEDLIYKSKLCMNNVVFEEPLQFMKAKFKNGFEFSNVTFKKEVVFTKDFINEHYGDKFSFDRLTFYKKINFDEILTSNIQEIEINNCNFKDKFEFPKQEEYKQKIKIIDTIFDDRVDFVERSFGNDLMIKNCVFNKDLSFAKSKFLKCIKFMPIDKHLSRVINITKFFNIKRKHFEFIENKVKDNIDFSDVSFEMSPNFQSSVFEKLVILYKTKFKEIPNFYSASFSSSAVLDMPLVDIKDYSFNHLKDEIKNKNDLIDIKGIRECLNIFKNALLKTNNILEASKYKVLELYAKELELDYKLKNKENKEEKITIKEKFDRWFLKLNRTTSDHHTDFLKIFLFTLSVIGGYFIANLYNELFVYDDKFFYILPSFVFLTFLSGIFIVSKKAKKIACSWYLMSFVGLCGIFYSPSIITPFLGAFSEDARNHYLYKAIDELDSQKALDLSKQILAKEPTSELNAKKTLKDYKDELKSSKLLNESPDLKRAVAIDGGVSRLNIAYYLVLAFCIFALQKTMRKNSIIPS